MVGARDDRASGAARVEALTITSPAEGLATGDGGGVPAWRVDGQELYYLTPAGDLAALNVTPDDVTPDGQRFLVYTENRTAAPPLTVLAPWQRLLPGH